LKNIFSILLFFASFFADASPCNILIRGRVADKESKLPLPGAVIYTIGGKSGTSASADGSFEIIICQGQELIVSFMGYGTLRLQPAEGSFIVAELQEAALEAAEVQVYARSLSSAVQSAYPGAQYLSRKTIAELPQFLGQADPIRALSLAPGVSQPEGSQGFMVRGAGRQHNLVLLNGAVVHNASHLLGMFSVFNTESIQEVYLLKSGVPAQYGGRLSSVLCVELGTGRPAKPAISGTLGLLASDARVSAPVVPGKLWLSAAARRTHAGWVSVPISNALSGGDSKYRMGYYFYDFDFSADYSIKPGLSLDMLAYIGDDSFLFETFSDGRANNIDWGNRVFSARLRYAPKHSISWVNAASYSFYHFDFSADHDIYGLSLSTSLASLSYKSTATVIFPSGPSISFGLQADRHSLKPSDMRADISGQPLQFPASQQLYSAEPSIFIQAEFPAGERLLFAAGARLGYFAHLGLYNAIAAADTISYRKGQNVAGYWAPEPRFSARYMLTERSSAKISYQYMRQYMHMASMGSEALPADIWFPSSAAVKPAGAQQLSLGCFYAYGQLALGAEIYGRLGHGIPEVSDDFVSTYNPAQLENSAVFSGTRAAGAELSATRTSGKLTGSASVAVTQAFVYPDGASRYPAASNLPLDLSLSASYKTKRNWALSSVFAFSYGRPATLPVQRYLVQERLISYYSARNSARMPHYHRLDVSATRHFEHKRGAESWLSFGLYNAYSRKNPYYMYYGTHGDPSKGQVKVKLETVSLFPVLPSVSWKFKI
jgi:hypothetical protein